MSDRDVEFMSYSGRPYRDYGTTLKFFTAFQPQTNGQIEVGNHSLMKLHRCVVGEKQGIWDLTLPLVEFAYNNAVNRSTCKIPFDIIHGYSPQQPY